MTKENKKIIFSGIQPSGDLHIGNYLGAILQWVEMQKKYNCIFCVVDYHAITVKQDPKILNKKIIEVAKIYLASGIDPKKSIIFQQSDVSAHTELGWILNCVTKISDLNKMTQFKDKSRRGIKKWKNSRGEEVKREVISAEEYNKYLINKIGVGLFDYPVLMASDILLYNTDIVPVGDDQVQHVELCRALAKRFNQQFGETFKIPEAQIKKESARIMGLDNPNNKMSKSASSPANYIALTDKPKIAAKKIMKAITDSGNKIKFDQEKKPAISNLLVIYSLLADISIKNLEKKYAGKGYGDFKKDLAKITSSFLTKFQKKFHSISDKEVKKILDNGAKKTKLIAEKTLKKVKEKIGVN